MHVVYLVAKFPLPGQSKTRLAPALGEDGAAECSKNMILDTLERLNSLREIRGVDEAKVVTESGETEVLLDSRQIPTDDLDIVVYFKPSSHADDMRALLSSATGMSSPGAYRLMPMPPQKLESKSDLGGILKHALESTHTMPIVTTVTFVGSDCPHLPRDVILTGINEASKGNAYICPATDGGYVLLSVPAGTPSEIFDGVKWSTINTFDSQLAALQRISNNDDNDSSSCVVIGSQRYRDVDEPDDIKSIFYEGSPMAAICPHTTAFLRSKIIN
jgi:uncharacterized protein